MNALFFKLLPLLFVLVGLFLFLLDRDIWHTQMSRSECNARRQRLSLLSFTGLLGSSTALLTTILLRVGASSQALSSELQSVRSQTLDTLGLFFAFGMSLLIALAILVLGSRSCEQREGEVSQFALLLLAVAGALVSIDAPGLLQLFVGLEMISIATICQVMLGAPQRQLSEAGMKLFIFSSLGSLLLLFGGALLFGATQKMLFIDLQLSIAEMSSTSPKAALIFIGVLFSICGLLLKGGIAPFHFAYIDAFCGTQLPGRLSLGVILRGSALFAVFKLQLIAFSDPRLTGWGVSLSSLLVVFAFISVLLGTVIALRQVSFIRTLAWVSLIETGLALGGLVGISASSLSPAGLIFSWMISLTALVGILLLSAGVRQQQTEGSSTVLRPLPEWQGLGARSPSQLGLFLFFLATSAGLPLTAAFLPKLLLVQSQFLAGRQGLAYLSISGVLLFAIAYARVLMAAFTKVEPITASKVQVTVQKSPRTTQSVLLVLCLVLLLMSAFSTALPY